MEGSDGAEGIMKKNHKQLQEATRGGTENKQHEMRVETGYEDTKTKRNREQEKDGGMKEWGAS